VGGHGGRAAATERLMCVWGKGRGGARRKWSSESTVHCSRDARGIRGRLVVSVAIPLDLLR
jgi:hypothetical protein